MQKQNHIQYKEKKQEQKSSSSQEKVKKEIIFPEIEIPRLIDEYQRLNAQKCQFLHITLTNVYNKLYEYHLTQKFPSHFISQTPELLEKDLIALCQGVANVFSYFPRPVQLMSVIMLFNHQQNKGRLAQIYTGEGKTLIVAMLAVLIAIKKKEVVDIITSSPVLAKRDAEELQKFYSYFALTVSHNVDEEQLEENAMLTCYEAQVVYGDSHSFEGDILKHEYSELGTKGQRKEGYAIVDEVDSMLIDGVAHQTFLSSPLPGMLDISKILRLIWDEICKQETNLTKDKKNVIVYKDNQVLHMDLKTYISEILDFQIKEAIGKMILPYRLDYINFMKMTWIEKAICAKFYLRENQNYVIDKGQVRIVDFQNTGVIHKNNMTWQQGLHQFVQLKHNLNMTSISISTNFMSNVCFFKRYKNKILGLTGTLGSQFTKELLAKQYGVDFVIIPPNKPRLLQELPGKAEKSENEWLDEISKDVNEQLLQQRAVLIINKTINDVKNIENILKSNDIKLTIYTDDSQEIDKKIGKGEVIIATNLAGRGTDFITNEELEQSGGLHVIVTFLPRNVRIQEQAFGRTARQGRKGTARLIVQVSQSIYLSKEQQTLSLIDLFQLYCKNLENGQLGQNNLLLMLKFYRDQNERLNMNEMDQEMNELMNEDECFQTFCKIVKGKVNMKQDPAVFKSFEEKWGLYLEQHKDKGLNKQEVEDLFQEDRGLNPKYLIMQGLEKEKKEYLDEASRISNNDPAAVYYKGCLEIKKLTENSIQTGVKHLLTAKKLFQEKIDNENGCNLAFKLNRFYVQEFQSTDEQEDLILEQKKKKTLNFAAYEKQDIFEPLFEEITVSNIQPQTKTYGQFDNLQFEKPQQTNNMNPQQKQVSNQFDQAQGIRKINIHGQFENNQFYIPQVTRNMNRPATAFIQTQQLNTSKLNQTLEQNSNSQIPSQQKINYYESKKVNQFQNSQTNQNCGNNEQQNGEICEKKKEIKSAFDSKIKNQLKIYQKFINSIDDMIKQIQTLNSKEEILEFGWESTTENLKDINLETMQNEEWKDMREVINDGPFPKIGKLYKKKKETSFFEKLLMLCLGLIQIAAGIIVCACTAGTCVVLGSWLIEQGIADVTIAIKAFAKDVEIDWGQWGKNKVINLCATLALASPVVASKLSTLATTKVSMAIATGVDIYLNYNKNNFEEVKKAEEWLSAKEKKNLQTQYDIIKQIGNQSDQCKTKSQILLLAVSILNQQKERKIITETTSKEIENLVLYALDKGGVYNFKNTLKDLSGGFLKMQMAKFKSSQDIQSLKQNLNEVGKRKSMKFQEKINSQMVWLKKNQEQLKISLTNFPKMALDSFHRDTEIQKQLLSKDLLYELSSNSEEKLNKLNITLQKFLNTFKQFYLKISIKEIQELDLNSQKSCDLFYQKNIRSIIMKCFSEISDQEEPITIIFTIELTKVIEKQVYEIKAQLQSLTNLGQTIEQRAQRIKEQMYPNRYEVQRVKQMLEDYEQQRSATQYLNFDIKDAFAKQNLDIYKELFQKLQRQGLILQDGISLMPQFERGFNQLLAKQNISSSLKQFIQVAIKSTIKNANQYKYTKRKLFSDPFIHAFQCELLKPIENQIFQVKFENLEAEVQMNLKREKIL